MTVMVRGTMTPAQSSGVAMGRAASGSFLSSQCSSLLRTATRMMGGITVEVYVTEVRGIKRKLSGVSAVMPAAIFPQEGLASAMQHHTATEVLHLKCREPATAIKTGRKVKGIQEIML